MLTFFVVVGKKSFLTRKKVIWGFIALPSGIVLPYTHGSSSILTLVVGKISFLTKKVLWGFIALNSTIVLTLHSWY